MFAYILIVIPAKLRQKPTCPTLCYSSVVNMEKGKFSNFKNSYKIDQNGYNDNFFAVVVEREIEFELAEKFGGIIGNFCYYLR